MKKYLWLIIIGILLPLSECMAQPEVMAWGNITGIRIEGQLMEFESGLTVVGKDWEKIETTGKEKQRPKYDREAQLQIVTTSISSTQFIQKVEECGRGCIKVTLKATSDKDTLIEGVFFSLEVPEKYYAGASVRFVNGSPAAKSRLNIRDILFENNSKLFKISAKGVLIEGIKRKLEVGWDNLSNVFVRREANGNVRFYFTLKGQKIKKGDETERVFVIKADGIIDKDDVEIAIDAGNPGQKFAGLGGNFRLQNPITDPKVIQYCLDNLRVAYGRVEMPWNLWHPDENMDPIEAANSGNIDPRVKAAMEMAQRLTILGMPVILSVWSAPNWAIIGDPRDAYRYRSRGIFGYPLNPEKTEKIYKSIADYIQYLKQHFGVEAMAFSFNESDLGINIRHTGKEHADFIKGLGAQLASRYLTTKLLLGDNSDATTIEFIYPALDDPETHKYISAVSFHSWRGCSDETLKKWADAARKLNVPLIVGEGSTDAAAWNYPEIFSEQSFALYEINLYIRLCYFCQPLSILQWQLTSDYSVLTGDGIFGETGPLKPTQRFFNLKQLASTPEESFALPLTCSKEGINCAAFGNIARNEYAIHLVNNGAECDATIKGLPAGSGIFEVFVTDNFRGMVKTDEVSVKDGIANVRLASSGFISLISKKNE